jgi:hypothetical protein
MAFLRRKGNTFYLVHNVREGDRVKQLHLAKLGERPRITDDVVRQVTRSYPFVDVNWNELREQVNNRSNYSIPSPTRFRSSYLHPAHPQSRLADLFPPLAGCSARAGSRDRKLSRSSVCCTPP